MNTNADRRLHTLSRLLAAVVGLMWMMTLPALAHSGDQSYLYLDIAAGVSGRLEMPFIDIEIHLGLELDGTQAEIAAEIAAHEDRLWAYVQDHVELSDGTGAWPVQFVRAEQLYDIDYLGVTFDIGVEPERLEEPFEVSLDPFFDEDPDRDALLLVGNSWDQGYVDNLEESLQRFTPSTRTQAVDLGEASGWKNFRASVALGVDHIRTGADHILFIAVLLLPAVLVHSRVWRRATSLGPALWRTLKIVTMFTVAHSITFSLVGAGIVASPPSALVETIIAVSIGVAALHNLWPIAPEREWLLVFGFGLFHGLGFASLVSELDVSRTSQLISLAGRNVGIEIGQAAVVLVVFPVLFAIRRTRLYRPVFVVGSVVLAAIALGLAIERTLGGPTLTTQLLDQAFRWPRVLLLWLLAGAAALVFAWREAADQRLAEPEEPLLTPSATRVDESERATTGRRW